MIEQINETISVIAAFGSNGLVPKKFQWQGRAYEIKKVNLSYHVWAGRSKIYYFAVSDDCNYFKLQFNTDSLGWVLLESCAGN
jgi:hypothetical protein